MRVIALYRYDRPGGGTVITPEKPEGEHEPAGVRIIADDGMLITRDGVNLLKVIDDESAEGWTEIADPEAVAEEVAEDGVETE